MRRRIKNYVRNHKMFVIIVSIVVVVAILAGTIALVLLNVKNRKQMESASNETYNYDDLENRIADLKNEPVSEYDEIYKDENASKDKPYLIKVNKTQNCVTIYQKDKSGEYTVPFKAMICSVGYDTPVGTFKTSNKYTWKIVNGNVWAQYATRITGNVLFHSMPYASNDKGTLLVNYYNQMGSTLSASCIRLSAKDANWIMVNCPKETTVDIYESTEEEALERPVSIKVPENAAWDPTDPDKSNPWNQVELKFEGMTSEKIVERGTILNLLEGIQVLDTCGNDITARITTSSDMDIFHPGTYYVRYSVEDATGKKASESVTYQVRDTTPPYIVGLKETMTFNSIAQVTKANLLTGVTILDNNEILSVNKVEVAIPTISEGSNIIGLSVMDDYGNETTATINVIVKSNPPVIALKPNTASIIPLTQNVDREYALSRVTATDNGAAVPADKITVAITPLEWGYTIQYRTTDDIGNVGTFKNTVSYLEYSITINGETTVTDISNYEQLTKNMTIKDNAGGTLSNAKVQVTTKDLGDNKYTATYTYTYSSPLGERKASTNATVILKTSNAPPIATASPSAGPVDTQKPVQTESPSESHKPTDAPVVADE